MSTINLYKISESKAELFWDDLKQRYSKVEYSPEQIPSGWKFVLFISQNESKRPLTWDWVLKIFGEKNKLFEMTPSGIMFIRNKSSVYAVTFGYSYFFVNSYCDRNYAFDVARRMDYSNINITALTNPNSHRNKTINSYVGYNVFEFDSGEAFTKIKAKVSNEEALKLFKQSIEFGTSISIDINEATLEAITEVIEYFEKILKVESKHKIPLCTEVKSEERIKKLSAKLQQTIKDGMTGVEISEIDVIGTQVCFNKIGEYKFLCRKCNVSFEFTELTWNTINENFSKKQISLVDCIFDSEIGIRNTDAHKYKYLPFINYLEYADEEERCFLSQGKWYEYNDDYMQYLTDSLKEIHQDDYKKEFDLTKNIYDNCVEKCSKRGEKNLYAEDVFNRLREKNGFKNIDRQLRELERHKYEVADLYRNNELITVKIGKTSAKLCYAVEQSLILLRMLKAGKLPEYSGVQKISLWLVLEDHGKIDCINDLKMLPLKNSIDHWKKTVVQFGYIPSIRINYRSTK